MINFYNPNVRSKRTYEDVSAYTDAIKMIGLIMAEGSDDAAARKAEALGLDRVAHALHGKAALAAGNTTAAGLTDYGNMIGQFMDRAKQYGCFDRVADAAMPVADFAGRGVIFSGISSGAVVEGAAKPLKRILLSAGDWDPVKTAATVVLTSELMASSPKVCAP